MVLPLKPPSELEFDDLDMTLFESLNWQTKEPKMEPTITSIAMIETSSSAISSGASQLPEEISSSAIQIRKTIISPDTDKTLIINDWCFYHLGCRNKKKDEHIRQTRETPIRNQMYMNIMLQQNAMTA